MPSGSVIQGYFPHGLRIATLQPMQGGRATPDWVRQRIAVGQKLPAPAASAAAPVQRQAMPRPNPNGTSVALPPHMAAFSRVPGQPLPTGVRQRMEAAFGASFADVRIHVDAHPPAIGALAFTSGTDIHFAPGQWNPHTGQGLQLLGHELAHVIQQRAGRVRNPFGTGVAIVHDAALETEAERMGSRAEAAWRVPQQTALQRMSAGRGAIQRASSSIDLQQKSENTCWAACFAFLLGKKEHDIKMEWSLDASIYSLSYEDTKPLADKLGLTVVEDWYDAAFNKAKLPIAVGLPDHFIVVTALTKSANGIRATHVTYSDPADGKAYTVSTAEFNQLTPSIGVYK